VGAYDLIEALPESEAPAGLRQRLAKIKKAEATARAMVPASQTNSINRKSD
jgi:hypothetical protein